MLDIKIYGKMQKRRKEINIEKKKFRSHEKNDEKT